MKDLELFFKSIDPVLAALIATTFTWLVTAAGASLVFFFKTMHRGVLDGMLGFTGGVMVAASFGHFSCHPSKCLKNTFQIWPGCLQQ